MNRAALSDVVLKAVLAAIFFFVLQYFILHSSLETSLLWSAVLGAGAAALSWSQHSRTK